MAVVKLLARGWTFEVNTGTEGAPTWVPVTGISSWSHSPSKNDADTTTFDEEGWMSHLPASRSHAFTLTGKYKEDPSTGARDPGQEAVEAWAEEIGPDGLKQFRLTSPGGTVKTFLASAVVTIGGGGNDDASTWEATVNTSGQITTS